MSNTPNYYRDMKETLLDQRKKRIGRNDFKRSMNAKRDTDRVSLLLLGAAIIFVLGSTVSADERIPSSNYEDVLDIVDDYALHSGMSRSDFMFKVARQYHYANIKRRRECLTNQ